MQINILNALLRRKVRAADYSGIFKTFPRRRRLLSVLVRSVKSWRKKLFHVPLVGEENKSGWLRVASQCSGGKIISLLVKISNV